MANNSYPRAGDRTPSACAQREEYWRRVVARHRQSGLTASDFCKREDIKPTALSWWARELRQRESARKQPAATRGAKKPKRSTFVPVQVIEASPRTTVAETSAIEIVTSGGHVIRLKPDFDAATLRRAVEALESRSC